MKTNALKTQSGRKQTWIFHRLFLGLTAACVWPAAAEIPSVSEVSSALPNTTAAASFVIDVAESALPAPPAPTLAERAFIKLAEAGFLVGTTTAVHELGHARRVRAAGGQSRWETGDVNWWTYLSHRDPLSAGATEWLVPARLGVDGTIAIIAGGFNATTMWDEETSGRGPMGLVTARYSTLLYELAGVSSGDDDLSQLQQLYSEKGYKISRREMQLWQLAAGCVTQLNGRVRTYAYFTPRGVSLRAVVSAGEWTLAAETVVHGAAAAELEVGRRWEWGRSVSIAPRVLVCEQGLGGSLKADLRLGRAAVSLVAQKINGGSLQAWRSCSEIRLQFSAQL